VAFEVGDRVRIVGTDRPGLDCLFAHDEFIGQEGTIVPSHLSYPHFYVKLDQTGNTVGCMPAEALELVSKVSNNQGEKTMQNARKQINNLNINPDTVLLQEAAFERADGSRSDEGTEVMLDMLYRDQYRDKLIASLKLVKAKQAKDETPAA